MTQVICWGVYTCNRCSKEYTVNEPDSWRPCTSDLCHDCVEYLNTLHVRVSDPPELH